MNRHGQQHYLLLSTSAPGVKPLYTGKHLTTLECLDWIASLPDGPLYVGFAFGYDATQILRDLPPDRIAKVFEDKGGKPGRSRYTWFEDYAIEYLPKNYLRVARLRRKRFKILGKWETHVTVEPDSSRTIWETFGFFQKSFLQSLRDFDIGRKHWTRIARNKEQRADFVRVTKEIRRYNELECDLLAQLMEAFRAMCHGVGLRPKTWNGSGKLAAFEHQEHGTITADVLALLLPDGMMHMAASAYYGGRFEVTRTGEVSGPVWEYDIGSAYPAAMRELPCLLHGKWEPFTGSPPRKSLHVGYVSFSHPNHAPLCTLPIRKKDGRLFWPRQGQGVYWSQELTAARRAGARIRYTAGWRYIRNCECHPFDWIAQRYAQRNALGKNTKGYPIKLSLNSLYGKLAQRIGNPRWGNLIWAGMITAITRAQLIDAANQCPDAIVMFATDAVFSRQRLNLPISDELGAWEEQEHARLHIVQPGLYWGASRPKTRGVPASLFTDHIGKFEQHWRLWCLTDLHRHQGPPIVPIPLPLFIGLRLAHARGKPETAGKWTRGSEAKREFSYDWTRKRAAAPIWETPLCVRTMPDPGAPDLVSVPHKLAARYSDYDTERMELEDQPDHLDMSPP